MEHFVLALSVGKSDVSKVQKKIIIAVHRCVMVTLRSGTGSGEASDVEDGWPDLGG